MADPEQEGYFKVRTDLSEDEARVWRNPNLPAHLVLPGEARSASVEEAPSLEKEASRELKTSRNASHDLPGSPAASSTSSISASTVRYFGQRSQK
jgi:hypothetical protein